VAKLKLVTMFNITMVVKQFYSVAKLKLVTMFNITMVVGKKLL